LGDRVILAGGREIELESLGEIPANAETVLVQAGKIILGGVMALDGRGFIVSGGLGVVAGNAVTVLVEIAEKEFGVEIVLRSAATEPGESAIIPGDGRVFIEKELGELILSREIAGFCARFEFRDGVGGRLLGDRGERA
jgi:hypothetical protein